MHPVIDLLLKRERKENVGIIDLRDLDSFCKRHISQSLHIAGLEGLRHRFSWLPPPKTASKLGRELIVICRKDDRAELERLLNRWNVVGCVDGNDEHFWSDAAAFSEMELIMDGETSSDDIQPLLFEPSPILEPALQAVERGQSGRESRELSILDLGMGAGRDLAWTVKRDSSFTWLATGIDNLLAVVERAGLLQRHYRLDQRNTSRIEKLIWAQATEDGCLQAMKLVNGSKSRGISDKLSDSLTHFATSHLPRQHYDLILFVRFYNKELIDKITALTHDKSIIAISHFTTMSSEADYASPDSSKRFEEDHIAEFLNCWGQEWKVIYKTIDRSEDNRPLRSVLFQRSKCNPTDNNT